MKNRLAERPRASRRKTLFLGLSATAGRNLDSADLSISVRNRRNQGTEVLSGDGALFQQASNAIMAVAGDSACQIALMS